ncbi:MAG TPA: hypothetical protein VL357_06820 [Rariglobus sp.]|jgi:hypothetical protein|nr:hypothetical protein [Rariglobus sp.]
MLNKLERIFGRYAITHLSLYLVIGQVGVYLLWMLGSLDVNQLLLIPSLVRQGEVWRLFTFFFVPPASSPLFIAFAWYLFYLMGTALESYWGAFRFNLFVFIGGVLTVAVGFLTPGYPVSNAYIAGSVFLAFAYLNPDFELALFLILPVRIKWLALLTWAGYAAGCVIGDWGTRLQILASTGNFLLFFGHDILLTMRMRRRRMAVQADRFARTAETAGPRHRCHVCGKNSDTHRDLDFRYCSKCAGDQCYCPDHIFDHVHVTDEEDRNARR